jgi:ligand-binding sensor domain-containing protein
LSDGGITADRPTALSQNSAVVLNHGVSVYDGETWKNYGVIEGPIGERIFAIAVCPADGDVWIATSAGLTRY